MADIKAFPFQEQQDYLTENTAGFAEIEEAFVSGTTVAGDNMRVGTIILDSSNKAYLVTEIAESGAMTGIALG